jgi:hypothetical protein
MRFKAFRAVFSKYSASIVKAMTSRSAHNEVQYRRHVSTREGKKLAALFTGYVPPSCHESLYYPPDAHIHIP